VGLRLIRLPEETIVTALSVTPVKSTRLRAVRRVELDRRGARGDRVFHVIDDRGRLVNGKRVGELATVVAAYDEAAGQLELSFPDGTVARGAVRYGETVTTRFFSHEERARELVGPWSEALSSFFGRSLRLATTGIGVDRGRAGGVTIISRASLRRLAERAHEAAVDARRFRMLVEVDGVEAHAEDRWVGRRVRVGTSVVGVNGNVGRCLVTSHDPDTGAVDLPVLDLLRSYRAGVTTTETTALRRIRRGARVRSRGGGKPGGDGGVASALSRDRPSRAR
jgi:uncharacterized protein